MMTRWIEPLLPKQFDENEIYALVVVTVILTLVLWFHNRDRQMLGAELIFIWMFNLFYSSLGDFFLAMPPYDYYDTVDRNSGEFTDILLQNFGYTGFAFLTVHFYRKYQPKKLWFLGYVFLSIALTLTIETVGVRFFHLYTFKNWSAFRSFLFYIPVYFVNFWLSDKVRAYIVHKKEQPTT